MHKLTPPKVCFSNLWDNLQKCLLWMSENVSFLTHSTPYSIYGFT